MTGRQANVTIEGSRYEALAAHFLGQLAAPVKVPREHDFGIDFFCQTLTASGVHSVDSEDVFGVQVKGGDGAMHYGGMRDGKWRPYEISWLRSVMMPLFLARMEQNPGALNLYSMGPVWRVFWQTAEPFAINCEPEPVSAGIQGLRPATRTVAPEMHGDSTVWTVPLGPPLLRITESELSNPDFIPNARYVLKRQLQLERRNLMNFFQGVAIHECLSLWSTNSFVEQAAYHRAMYWDRTRGKNISLLASAVAPGLVNLGVHLQWQDDPDAYRLLDLLEWLSLRGALDAFGIGLLNQLKERQAQSLPPAPDGASQN